MTDGAKNTGALTTATEERWRLFLSVGTNVDEDKVPLPSQHNTANLNLIQILKNKIENQY